MSSNGGKHWKWIAVLSMSVGAAYGMVELHAKGQHEVTRDMVTQKQMQSVEKRLDRIDNRLTEVQRFMRMFGQMDR